MTNEDLESLEAACPSCGVEGSLKPALAKVNGQTSARLDPLDMGIPIEGVFVALRCNSCAWGYTKKAEAFVGSDPTADGAGVLFAPPNLESFLEEYRINEEATFDA